jgi:hypothetical protein
VNAASLLAECLRKDLRQGVTMTQTALPQTANADTRKLMPR